MRRREFIGLLGGATLARPLAARAQQPALPVVGFFRSHSAAISAQYLEALRQGLGEAGFVEGRNIAFEQAYADGDHNRLPDLAAALVRRGVTVIVANGPAAEAAKAATATIPIVFVIGTDPVAQGLVASLSRPGGNLTGVNFFGGGELVAKRLQLLTELAPKASVIGFLVDPNWRDSMAAIPEVEAAARGFGRAIVVEKAATEGELAPAFTRMVQAGAGALLVSGTPVFSGFQRRIVDLAASQAIPAIYDVLRYVDIGGLMSYSASVDAAYRQVGVDYVGRILKGAKPADLAVQQPTRFELVINGKTAKTLGLTITPLMLAQADEVIE